MQGTNVGGLFYTVVLDTKKMVDEQRRVDAELQKTAKSLDGFEAKLNVVAQAVKAYADDLASGGRTARAVQSRFNLKT